MIRRKPLDDEDENHERWLVSYADFITLLFAFFVVMYAISSVNQKKYEQLSDAMGSAFTGKVSADGQIIQLNTAAKAGNTQGALQKNILKPLPLSQLQAEKAKKERETMLKVAVDLSSKLTNLINEKKVNVGQNNLGVRIDINDSLLFEPGSADLSQRASPLMAQISEILNTSHYAVQIEGHTDNTPIHSEVFFSNWELSALRASSVVRMLIDQGVQEKRLSATGFGSTQPISDNETPEGRSKNRRVAIMIMYQSNYPIDSITEPTTQPTQTPKF